MQGKFVLFINIQQAAHLGHAGWGFLMDDGKTYMYGATDHLYRHHEMDLPAWIRYMNVPAGQHTDWWCDYGSIDDMKRAMCKSQHHIWYHYAKVVNVEDAHPKDAEKLALSQETAGWSVFTNNCTQQTYQLVSAYGAGVTVPNPNHNPFNLIPRVWFNSFEGEVWELHKLPESPANA